VRQCIGGLRKLPVWHRLLDETQAQSILRVDA
jgi:hypothetical protein